MSRTDRTTESEHAEGEEHVCAFCGTAFDVDRRSTCPLCEAEVVLRGRRR